MLKMRDYFANEEKFKELWEEFATEKDDLLPCKFIRIDRDQKLHASLTFVANKNEIQVFSILENSLVIDYLSKHKEIWDQAALRVTCIPIISGSAPYFGVPFHKALEIALKKGTSKSKFYLPATLKNGRHSSLLIQIDRKKTSDASLQLQAWKYSAGDQSARYIHALSTDFSSHISHLDGAIIQFSEADLETHLRESRKIKGYEYKKYFRIDGDIKIKHMHNLAKCFFRCDLYDEAFEIESLD